MVDEDPEPEPKPLVDFAYIDNYEQDDPDILDLYEKNEKIPFGFGKKGKTLNKEIIRDINKSHKRPELKHFFVPYDIDVKNDKDLIGPPIPKNFIYGKDSDDIEEDYSSVPKKEYIEEKKIKKLKEESKDDDEVNDVIKSHKETGYLEDYRSDSNEDMQSDEEEEDNAASLEAKIPISHIVELTHTPNKAINSLDIDRSGNRMVSGSIDGTVKIWDFNNLTRKPAAFQTIEVCEGYPVLTCSWAPSGGFFLAATGDCQAKVYDRDGNFEIGCLKGDNYLHDINNTKGHTYPLTDGHFHPKEKNLFITSSRDSTIREWDIYSKPMGIDQEIMQTTILRARTFKNHKICVNSCAYSNDGSIIVGGIIDGSLQFWYRRASQWKPDIHIPDAHAKDSEITSVKFFDDNIRFLSRGADSTMRMWDLRRPKKPLFTWEDLPSFTVNTGMTISPDESIIATGTSVKRGHENSQMVFYSSYNYEKIKQIPVCTNSVVSLVWNDKINQ